MKRYDLENPFQKEKEQHTTTNTYTNPFKKQKTKKINGDVSKPFW